MSRIGKQPITIPAGVKIQVAEQRVSLEGLNGTLTVRVPALLRVHLDDQALVVRRIHETRQAAALHGLTRTLIANAVHGVSTGFQRTLLIEGIGYRAQVKEHVLTLQVGKSHPVNFPIPDGITVETPKPTQLIIKGADKQAVGQVAADIRAVLPPEPYKGKGIRYRDEVIRRKAGKTAATGAK
jgi:large subunit ribosomal protein L6